MSRFTEDLPRGLLCPGVMKGQAARCLYFSYHLDVSISISILNQFFQISIKKKSCMLFFLLYSNIIEVKVPRNPYQDCYVSFFCSNYRNKYFYIHISIYIPFFNFSPT